MPAANIFLASALSMLPTVSAPAQTRRSPGRHASVPWKRVQPTTTRISGNAGAAGESARLNRPPAIFLSCRCRLAHEFRQAGAALALEPLGLEDRLHFGKRFIDVVIDHDVIVFGPVAQFMAGAAPCGRG